MRVYPRVCGETGNNRLPVAQGQGLSPRVRGNQARPKPGALSIGSIPACAGKPPARLAHRLIRWVYPRVCGGTERNQGVVPLALGLSPRVRGNLNPDRHIALDLGSIPARAGEPLRSGTARP